MEIAELRHKQGNDSSASNNGVEKLKNDYLRKLNVLEEQVNINLHYQCENILGIYSVVYFSIMVLQVTELKKKLDSQPQFSTQRKRVDESTKQMQFEIQSLKAQKVTILKWAIFLK